jgi:hypothetical protein
MLSFLFLRYLSDVRVCAEASDWISFRRFLDLGPGDTVPDDTPLTKGARVENLHQLDRP